jgi:7-cyano-7-deazaguanine synthase
MTKQAVVLLSGGVDSSTTLALAKADGYEVSAMSFRYGQRHAVELERAKLIARRLDVTRHIIVDIDLREIGGSALTADIAVPKDRSSAEIGEGVPVTYVPARNTIFLAFALAWAEVLGVEDIFIGANAVDFSGYPDCRPEYIHAFEQMANLATKAGVEGKARFRVHTPLIQMTKAEIIRRGRELGVDYQLTWSCYDPVYQEDKLLACGRCDSCLLRLKGFAEARFDDPIAYASRAVESG